MDARITCFLRTAMQMTQVNLDGATRLGRDATPLPGTPTPRAFCAAVLGVLCPSLLAGPPLITDDPGTPGDGRWEINLAFAAELRRASREFDAPLLDINYGLGDHIQLKYEIPWIVLDEEGEHTKNGIGNSLVGVKWRFLDEDRHGLDMSVYPQVEFNNSRASTRRHLVTEETTVLLPFQVAKSLGQWEVLGELGYASIESETDQWFYGLAVGHPVTPRLELLAEIHGEAQRDFRQGELIFNVGAVYELTDNINLLASVGRGFRESSSGEPQLLTYLAVQFNF